MITEEEITKGLAGIDQIIPGVQKKTLVLFDLDGTIVDNSERATLTKIQDYLDPVRLAVDPPMPTIVALLRKYATAADSEVVFLTGREEKLRDVTEVWLKGHHLSQFTLYMRPNGLPIAIVSKYKANKTMKLLREGGYQNIIFYDDNASTVTKVYKAVSAANLKGDFYQVSKGKIVREEHLV